MQREHWRHLSGPEDTQAAVANEDKSKSADNVEPEDVEKCISSFLYDKTAIERKRILAANILKAEDIVRAAGLNAEATAQLMAASRGATEESLTTWKWFIEQQIRSQLQEVTPQNVKQRLEGFEDFVFQRNYDTSTHSGVWEKALQTELNDKQRASWTKETDARKLFHDQAIAELVMAEFDRKNQLTADQWEKLEPLVVGSVRDYSSDISRIFSFNNGVPWYLGGPYTLMPFAGIPDADLKAILSADQWNRWKGSSDCSNASNLWQNVQQFHNQRVPPKK